MLDQLRAEVANLEGDSPTKVRAAIVGLLAEVSQDAGIVGAIIGPLLKMARGHLEAQLAELSDSDPAEVDQLLAELAAIVLQLRTEPDELHVFPQATQLQER